MMETSRVHSFIDLYAKHSKDGIENNNLHLWHYTNIDGLFGILGYSSDDFDNMAHFWFTRSDSLNDTSEGKHILDIFKEVCNKLFEQEKIDSDYYHLIINSTIDNYHPIFFPIPPEKSNPYKVSVSMVNEKCEAFICSFSLCDDSLDLWRYYSKSNPGYALKFSGSLFNILRNYEISQYNANDMFSKIKCYKVIYDKMEKERIIEELIIDTYSAFKDPSYSDEQKKATAIGFIESMLKRYQFQFKNDGFLSEKEYRFVYYRPIDKPKELENELPRIYYRNHNGIPVPYIIVKGDLFLEEVKISPFIKSELVKRNIQDFLKNCNIDSVTVSQSSLPTC